MSFIQLIEQFGADASLRNLNQQQMFEILKQSMLDFTDSTTDIFSNNSSEKHCIMQVIFDEDEQPESQLHAIVQVPCDCSRMDAIEFTITNNSDNLQVKH